MRRGNFLHRLGLRDETAVLQYSRNRPERWAIMRNMMLRRHPLPEAQQIEDL